MQDTAWTRLMFSGNLFYFYKTVIMKLLRNKMVMVYQYKLRIKELIFYMDEYFLAADVSKGYADFIILDNKENVIGR